MSSAQKPFRGMQIDKTHPLARGLVGCWIMNERTGSKIFDLSGHGNDGTIYGATWVSDGLDFDGTNDYVDIPNDKLILPANSNHTACCWVTMPNVNDVERRMFFESANSYIISLGWGNDDNDGRNNLFQAYTYPSATGKYALSTTHPNANETYFVCTRVDSVANTIGIFVNGVLETENSIGTGTIPSSAGLHIGTYRSANDRWMDGQISNTIVWNRALSSVEIAWLHREPYTMFEQPVSPGLLYHESVGGVANPYWYYQMLRRRNE